METGEVNLLNIIPQSISVNGSGKLLLRRCNISVTIGLQGYPANLFIDLFYFFILFTASATTVTPVATTVSGGLKIESSLLQATCLIFMSNILILFL